MISIPIAVCGALLAQPVGTPRSLGEPWFEMVPGLWEFNPTSSNTKGVSGDGTVVYGAAYGPNMWEGMTWTRDGGVVARGGSFLGDSTPGGDRFAGGFDGLFIVGTGWVKLGIPPGANSEMYASGISADGLTVVGSARIGGVEHPAIWTEAEGARLITLPAGIGPRGWAMRASTDGSVIVGSDGASAGRGWVMRDGVVTHLPPLALYPQDMTPDGRIMIGGNGNDRWYYRPPIGYQPIPDGDCDVGVAWATDATGGYMVGGNSPGCAFIYDRFHGTRNLQTVMVGEFGLDLGDLSIEEAVGISDDGRVITGKGRFQGGSQSWVAYLPLLRCPGDFNGDDRLDFFDLLEYLQAFAAQDPMADYVQDGTFNFFDVATFLDRFSMGCL